VTAPEWRDCADPDELAAAVAAGVEVLAMGRAGDFPTANQTADQFAGSLRAGITYQLPASWTWSPEPPAPDDLAARARRHADTHPESRDLIEELLGAVEMLRHYDVTCEDGGTFIPVVVVWDPHVPGLVVTRDIRESWKQRGPAQPVAPDGTVEVLKVAP